MEHCEKIKKKFVVKVVIGSTRARSVGHGVGAIEIGLALRLIDPTEAVATVPT